MSNRCQVSGVRCQAKKINLINNYWSLVTFVLMFTVHCSLFTVVGCGGSSAPTLPAIHAQAIEYNQNAAKAAEKGDYEKALDYYMEALRINQSVENTGGIVINLINLAVIYQKQGNISEAEKLIDMVFLIPDINDSMKAEAAFEKARIFLKEKELSKAKEWVNKSLALNKGIREGSRWNLLGRIALIEGNYSEALTAANTALKLNSGNKQRAEEANSMRLIAEIRALTDKFEESREAYMKALEIDKESGDSKKIAVDLKGIGDIFLKYGRLQDAVNFYIRAYTVSRTAEDIEGASKAAESLADAYRKSGDDKKAEEILKTKMPLDKKK
ncbi:MAG: tetratricopeptide repeat protein [Thermodesulfovibrionales bacterium]|nr:tetratricopeptide repeat protein [Thermodesulfovibrionales bacterium]